LLPILKRSIILGNYDIEVIGNMLRVVWHIYYENLYDTRMERFYIDLKRSRSWEWEEKIWFIWVMYFVWIF